VVSWRVPEIFDVPFNLQRNCVEVQHLVWDEMDVSAQLAFFLVALNPKDEGRDRRISSNGYQCEKRYPVLPFAEIAALLGLAIWGFAWGLPRRNAAGFAATLSAEGMLDHGGLFARRSYPGPFLGPFR
jgi:hypothetical protein